MKGVFWALAAIAVLLIGTFVRYWMNYYSEYNELLREIRRHPHLQIVDHWRHEDVTLEDFGFAVRSPRVTAFVDIVDGSSIRRPQDPATGIKFHLPREVHQEGNTVRVIHRFIEFDGVDWQQRGLPKIHNIAELLIHFDLIVHSLLTAPPAASTHGPLPDFISLNLSVDRQRSKVPAEPLSKL